MEKCKAMMEWVDARVDLGLAFHNRKYHQGQVPNAFRIERRAESREKEMRMKLLKKVM
jgi:hypothetical protein